MDKCFLDSNFLLYLIDEDSSFHAKAKQIFLGFEKNNTSLFLSHQVIEEFMFIILKLSRLTGEDEIGTLRKALNKIGSIPNLALVSLPDEWTFVQKVADFVINFKLSPNDSFILQVLLFYKITYLASFDDKLLKIATRLKIKTA